MGRICEGLLLGNGTVHLRSGGVCVRGGLQREEEDKRWEQGGGEPRTQCLSSSSRVVHIEAMGG